MIKKIILTSTLALGLLLAVIIGRTLTLTMGEVSPGITLPSLDTAAAAERLSRAIQIPTISVSRDAPAAAAEFDRLHALIDEAYPLVAARLQKEVIAEHSLLYTWQGTDPTLPAALLMGHMDVVPVESGTAQNWQHPPFSGAIADGAIWGRGTLDDKLAVFAILEAAEYQLSQDYAPNRTLLFAFGHDEEIGGSRGAASIAATLEARGTRLAFTLDEGMVIIKDLLPGIEPSVAVIALAEKGYLTLKLTATAQGGHSSMPPASTAVGKLSRAIASLEANQMPASLQRPARDLFTALAPYLPLSTRALIANLWLFEPLLVSVMSNDKTLNALLRTTTAATIIEGGTKDNVLPSTATATVNFRLLPGDSIERVIQHVTETINDPDISLTRKQGSEPSLVSSTDSDSYRIITQTINDVFPEVMIAPGLMLAGSDSKHYQTIADDNYRFLPMRLKPSESSRIHGTDEHIMVKNYGEVIQFYRRMMANAGG